MAMFQLLAVQCKLPIAQKMENLPSTGTEYISFVDHLRLVSSFCSASETRLCRIPLEQASIHSFISFPTDKLGSRKPGGINDRL